MDTFDDWALTLAVFIPLVGAVVMLLIPRAEEGLHKLVALVTTVVTAGVGVAILTKFDFDEKGLQFGLDKKWIDVINSRYEIGIDGISLAGSCTRRRSAARRAGKLP